MGLAKKETTTTGTPLKEGGSQSTVDSGTEAAISRLRNTEAKERAEAAAPKPTYKPRDFDAEARGKSLCLLYGSAIGSPLIAGLQFDKREEAFDNMKFFVNKAMEEIFKDNA